MDETIIDEFYWSDLDALYGLQAGLASGPWSNYDFQAIIGFPEQQFHPNALVDSNNDGFKGFGINIMNDTRADGDNVFVLRIRNADPAIPSNLGFIQDVFVFEEALVDVPANTYYSTDLGMTTGSTIQTAIVVIRDDESPNRLTNGDNAANTYTFTDAVNDTMLLGGGNDVVNAGGGNDIIFGQVGNDTLRGQDGNDMLFGNAGNDSLVGGNGNDTLDGGADADNLVGGTGNDLYIVDAAGDTITELVNEGIDTVKSSVTYTLGNNLENLILTGYAAINGTGNALDNFITGNSANNIISGGAGNDRLDGSLGNDSLYGGAGNDTLDGGSGADRLEGGDGNDLYIVDDLGDVIVDTSGVDTVLSRLFSESDLGEGSGLENLILESGFGAIGNGNGLNNRITGNEKNNALYGSAGNDTLFGVDGDDNLMGGSGNDLLYGGTGKDSLYGNDGDDLLYGGLGIDFMNGGDGNDIYYVDVVGDVVAEIWADAIGGVDTVFSSVSYSLSPGITPGLQGFGIENLTLTGNANINATGNDLDNVLIGNNGNNILIGGAGNDRLNGYGTVINNSSQFDTLTGGGGSDIFVLGSVAGAYYNETGDGYAVITDWDPRSGSTDTVFDRIEVNGSIGQYRLDTFRNVIGGAGWDTEIIYLPTGDRIGIVQDSLNVQLNRDFIFV